MQLEVDEDRRRVKIISFPAPEILSIEPDLKYYNLENGLLNKFSNQDRLAYR
ncbi:MAG: hypothetical protein HWD58_07635 [Bacteroidota bacterium]|nr:MAG: hypothetical protein HWD58_07635 [Bacteroidota bacterium]